MIKLIGGYRISADSNGYQLQKTVISGPETKSPGEEYVVETSYHSSLAAAVRACVKRVQRAEIAAGEVETLEDALRRFGEIQQQIEALAFPGDE